MKIEKDLKPGDAGVEDTTEIMRDFAVKYKNDPTTKALVKRITAGLKTDIAKIKALFNYVVKTMRYQSDPADAELVMSVKHTLHGNKRYGDCDDLSTALATLLICAGYKCGYKTVAWKPEAGDNFSHVYVMVEYEGGLLPLDPTMKEGGFGREVPHIRRSEIYPVV